MNNLTGRATINGKSIELEMSTTDRGNGLFIWEKNNWNQKFGHCQFHAGKNNKNLKKAIREELLRKAGYEMDQDFMWFDCETGITFTPKFRVSYR